MAVLQSARDSTRLDSRTAICFAGTYPDAAGRGGGSAPSSILTAPSRDGKLLGLT